MVVALLERTARAVENVSGEPRAIVSISEFAASFIVYEVFFWIDTNQSTRDLTEASNDVKIACWRALKDAGMTFSTDVATAVEVTTIP